MNLDVCPRCGKPIKDFDELGCEAPDGQRWCIEHALGELARYRNRATPTVGYVATDIARHRLDHDFLDKEPDPGQEVTVGEWIAKTCLVGYGGHFYETMDGEDVQIHAMACHLAPLYAMGVDEMTKLIQDCRHHYGDLMVEQHLLARERWRNAGWEVPS